MRIRFVVTKVWFAILGLTFSVATAAAQSGKLPNPADPRAAAPALKYESPFAEYQPFRDESIRSWQEVNKEVADNPGMGAMGSMKHTPGMTMPGMGANTGEAPNNKGGAAGHDMGAMKDMPGKPMPGMDKQAATASKGKEGAPGHDMGAMKGTPGKPMAGMNKPAAGAPMSKEGATGHDMGAMKDMHGKTMAGMNKQDAGAPMSTGGHGAMAMAKPQTAPGQAGNPQSASVRGTGVVQDIDKANRKVQLTHDPIAALGWPKMTMFFRLKDSALADQIKAGEKVEFSLEKSASGYVISGFQKADAGHDMKSMK